MFNKDDEAAINFVASASNIRAFNFSIPMEVRHIHNYLIFICRLSSRSKRWLERLSLLFQALTLWWQPFKLQNLLRFWVATLTSFMELYTKDWMLRDSNLSRGWMRIQTLIAKFVLMTQGTYTQLKYRSYHQQLWDSFSMMYFMENGNFQRVILS